MFDGEVMDVDWFRRMPTGGGTVYVSPPAPEDPTETIHFFARMPTGGTVYERKEES